MRTKRRSFDPASLQDKLFNQRFFNNTIKAGLALTAIFALNAVPAQAKVVRDDNCEVKRATNLPLCQWQDSELEQKGCVVLVHGLTQRAANLEKLGIDIASHGYTVWAIDLRGHGFWHFAQDKKADGYKCNYKKSVVDVVSLVKTIKAEHPDMPTFCIGESAGAAVIARAAVKTPESIDGLVLCSSGVKGCHFKCSWVLHDLVSNFFRINHPFDIVRYQWRYASDDKNDLPESLKDPWIRRSISALELLRTKKIVCGTAKVVKKLDPSIPILFLQGSKDQVLRPDSVQKVVHNARTPYKKLVVVPGCGHIMLATNHLKPLVVSSIDGWLERQTGTLAVARANTSLTQ